MCSHTNAATFIFQEIIILMNDIQKGSKECSWSLFG